MTRGTSLQTHPFGDAAKSDKPKVPLPELAPDIVIEKLRIPSVAGDTFPKNTAEFGRTVSSNEITPVPIAESPKLVPEYERSKVIIDARAGRAVKAAPAIKAVANEILPRKVFMIACSHQL